MPDPKATECIYTISQPKNMHINLTILMLDVNGDHDFTEIRDGSSEESSLMGVFRGTEIPPSMQSLSNFMWIR